MTKKNQAKIKPIKAQHKPKPTTETRGRKSKIKNIDVEQLKKLVERGFTNFEIADFFKMSDRTFQRYLAADEQFCHALKEWKQGADARVERALFERACGYSHQSEEIFCAFGKITRASTVKHYPPDVAACIIWLKNRKPEQWRENPPAALDPLFQDAELEFVGVPNQKDPAFEKKYREKYEQN